VSPARRPTPPDAGPPRGGPVRGQPGRRGAEAAPARPAYAGLGVRLLALVLDVLLLAAVFFPVTRLVKGAWVMTAADHRWARGWFVTDPLCLIFLAGMFLYFVLFEGLAGATLGKRALGLRVVSEGYGRVGLGQALVRNVLRVVDSLPALGIVAAILISSSHERARFGDRVAATRVIRTRWGTESATRT
jgi:uncharacterized RDD family membrane protein YckC